MKKLALSLLIVVMGTCVLAQDKLYCFSNNKVIECNIDSTNSGYFLVTINVDSCSSMTINISSEYYYESDSIIIKIRKKNPSDGINYVHASYCYNVGPHNIALYLNPRLFNVSTKGSNDFFCSIELFYRDEEKYRRIEN